MRDPAKPQVTWFCLTLIDDLYIFISLESTLVFVPGASPVGYYEVCYFVLFLLLFDVELGTIF